MCERPIKYSLSCIVSYIVSVAHRMSHQADGHSKIDQVQKCFCKVWRSIENVRVLTEMTTFDSVGDSRTHVQDRQKYSACGCVQQLARTKPSISAENRNFSCLGAPVQKLGATWASTILRRMIKVHGKVPREIAPCQRLRDNWMPPLMAF